MYIYLDVTRRIRVLHRVRVSLTAPGEKRGHIYIYICMYLSYVRMYMYMTRTQVSVQISYTRNADLVR